MSTKRMLALLLTLLLTFGTAAPVLAQTSPPTPPARLQFGDTGTRVSPTASSASVTRLLDGFRRRHLRHASAPSGLRIPEGPVARADRRIQLDNECQAPAPRGVSHRSTSGLVVEIHNAARF
jgi:hypothetical protein